MEKHTKLQPHKFVNQNNRHYNLIRNDNQNKQSNDRTYYDPPKYILHIMVTRYMASITNNNVTRYFISLKWIFQNIFQVIMQLL